jgi:hypothetical protein
MQWISGRPGVAAAIAIAVVVALAIILVMRRSKRRQNHDRSVVPPDELLALLARARGLLELPGNDFAWSSWTDAAAAIEEIDRFISGLREGQGVDLTVLQTLFAPTGPIQEVSLSSGWGKEFLTLAKQFDQALAWYRNGEA